MQADKVQRLLEFIELHIDEKLSISALAELVHLSPFHFARRFKLATGHAPHAYVTARRVERAKILLASGEVPLAQVATRVGFSTQGHFTEVFRRHAGLTPRRFRVKARNEVMHSTGPWSSEISAGPAAGSPSLAKAPGT